METKKKVELYCKNPTCFNQYLANHKIKSEKIKCNYPGCKKDGEGRQRLGLINEEDAGVELEFCKYHHFIIMGAHFKAKIINPTQNLLGEKRGILFEIIGPLLEVEVAEQVMGAREMVAALTSKETIKKLKKTNKSTDLEIQTAYESGIKMGKKIIKQKL